MFTFWLFPNVMKHILWHFSKPAVADRLMRPQMTAQYAYLWERFWSCMLGCKLAFIWSSKKNQNIKLQSFPHAHAPNTQLRFVVFCFSATWRCHNIMLLLLLLLLRQANKNRFLSHVGFAFTKSFVCSLHVRQFKFIVFHKYQSFLEELEKKNKLLKIAGGIASKQQQMKVVKIYIEI